jgi:hypothetical protein
MTDQPEALRLADALDDEFVSGRISNDTGRKAAAELRRLHGELATAEYALRSKGYRKSCDIPACNCGDQWSHGGNADARLRELSSELHGSPVDMNGKTLLAGLSELVERAEKAEAEIERLRADAERYRHLCEYQRWTPEIEAAFDCSPKVLIDEAIDNSIKAMKEPK